jgi:hypothetical protein
MTLSPRLANDTGVMIESDRPAVRKMSGEGFKPSIGFEEQLLAILERRRLSTALNGLAHEYEVYGHHNQPAALSHSVTKIIIARIARVASDIDGAPRMQTRSIIGRTETVPAYG